MAVLDSKIRQENQIKYTQIGNEELNSLNCRQHDYLCGEFNGITKKLQELISEVSKVVGLRSIYKNQLYWFILSV